MKKLILISATIAIFITLAISTLHLEDGLAYAKTYFDRTTPAELCGEDGVDLIRYGTFYPIIQCVGHTTICRVRCKDTVIAD